MRQDVLYQLIWDDRVEAADIEIRVKRVLEWSAAVDASDIQVDSTLDAVVLSGSVGTMREKLTAEDLARDLHGVVRIENQIAVVPTESVEDETIARTIMDAIDRHALLDAGDFRVEAADGRVTLGGGVDTFLAKRTALDIAAATSGVQAIVDQIDVD